MNNLKEIANRLKSMRAKRIFVQYPEGLSMEITKISKELSDMGFEVILCLEPTFGACDVRDDEAMRFKADAILHIGHTDFGVKSKLPILYWEYFIDRDPIPILSDKINIISDYKKIGLLCSLQYCKSLESVKKFLEEKGFEVLTSTGEEYPGQILGCRYTAAKKIENDVDAFLVISAGQFHSLGLSLNVNKPVFNLDLEMGVLYSMDDLKKKFIKIIEWNKSILKDSKKIGIIVSWKRGQFFDPFEMKKKLESSGKEVHILAVDRMSPDKIEGMKFDLLINTACPRIGIDDLQKYKIPIVNIGDVIKEIQKL